MHKHSEREQTMTIYKTSHPDQKLGLNNLSPEQIILLHKLLLAYHKGEVRNVSPKVDVFFGEISKADQDQLISLLDFQTQLIEDTQGNTYFQKSELVQDLKS